MDRFHIFCARKFSFLTQDIFICTRGLGELFFCQYAARFERYGKDISPEFFNEVDLNLYGIFMAKPHSLQMDTKEQASTNILIRSDLEQHFVQKLLVLWLAILSKPQIYVARTLCSCPVPEAISARCTWLLVRCAHWQKTCKVKAHV